MPTIAPAGTVKAKARVTKTSESRPCPTTVEEIVRSHRKRPFVATFRRERTMLFTSSPTR